MRAIDAEHSVPLRTITFSGNRYVADADLGLALPVPLMVHGNARVQLSLVHVVAEQLLGGPVPKLAAYGYSARGRGAIDVPTLRLGGAAFGPIEGASVFDFTDSSDAPVGGMLGTGFLTSARVAVDFRSDSMLLGVARADEPNPALLADGYRHVPMRLAADGRVTIGVQFPSIDRTLPITPSTVANALTLHHPPFAGRVPMAPTSTDRSPSGTSPEVYASDDVAFEVAGIALRAAAVFEDLAAYEDVPDEQLGTYGMLGHDWMKPHRAVIDYANLVLYFLP